MKTPESNVDSPGTDIPRSPKVHPLRGTKQNAHLRCYPPPRMYLNPCPYLSHSLTASPPARRGITEARSGKHAYKARA